MTSANAHPDAPGVAALAQEVLQEAAGTPLDRAHAALDRAEAEHAAALNHALERPPEHERLVERRRDLAEADTRRQTAFTAETAAQQHHDAFRGRRPRGWWAVVTRRRARHDQAERAARLALDEAQAVLRVAREEWERCQSAVTVQERFHAGVVAKAARERRHQEEAALLQLQIVRDLRTALERHPELVGGQGLIAAASRVRQEREDEQHALAEEGARMLGVVLDPDEVPTPRPPW